MSDKYVYTDPQDLDYDKRYVLAGDENCPYTTQFGAKAFYEVLYVKDEKAAGEIQAYVMADEATAQAVCQQMAGFGYDASCQADVVLVTNSGEYVQGNIELYAQYGIIPEATPEAYASTNYMTMGGMTEVRTGLPVEPEPTPEPEPVYGLYGTTAKDTFGVAMSDKYVYTDPEDQDYDKRYVLAGDENCPYTTQFGAKAFYEVLYVKDGKAVGEIQAYVMVDEATAQAVCQQMAGFGYDASARRMWCW